MLGKVPPFRDELTILRGSLCTLSGKNLLQQRTRSPICAGEVTLSASAPTDKRFDAARNSVGFAGMGFAASSGRRSEILLAVAANGR